MSEKAKILLVDHDRLIRESLTLFLEDKDVHLKSCGTLQEGLEALRTERYDALLCDQGILSEDYTPERIKSDCPGMLCVVFTGPLHSGSISQKPGIDGFIHKPFSAQCIADLIMRIAGRKHPQDSPR